MVAMDEMPTADAPLDVDAATPAVDERVAPDEPFGAPVLAAPPVGLGRFM